MVSQAEQVLKVMVLEASYFWGKNKTSLVCKMCHKVLKIICESAYVFYLYFESGNLFHLESSGK